MKALLVRACLISAAISAVCSASTLTGSISGTCGFYKGTLSNVVYSQAFSGDGTFCTGFLSGGSFVNTGILQVGDIFALSHNTISASAPAGYGAFVDFTTTYQVTQEYLLTPPVASTTSTGTIKTFLQGTGTTDDGSGLGSCSEHSVLNLAGFSSPSGQQISIPITFGQPVSATETTMVTCSDYGAIGHGFGDDGVQQVTAGPLLVYDANGKLLGPATISTLTPEPSTLLLIAPLTLAGLLVRKRRASL